MLWFLELGLPSPFRISDVEGPGLVLTLKNQFGSVYANVTAVFLYPIINSILGY